MRSSLLFGNITSTHAYDFLGFQFDFLGTAQFVFPPIPQCMGSMCRTEMEAAGKARNSSSRYKAPVAKHA